MRALLDTNILIHREASKVINEEIGILFRWLDRLHYEKCVHPLSLDELQKHVACTIISVLGVHHLVRILLPQCDVFV
jgi:hypothetical protein